MLAFLNTILVLLSHVPPRLIPFVVLGAFLLAIMGLFLFMGLVFTVGVVVMDKVLTWVERRYLKKGNANEKNS